MAMIRDQIMQMAQSDPSFSQAIDAMEKAVINMPITPEDLDEIIALLEFVIQNPDKYGEVRQAAIEDEEIDENTLPPQFDPIYIISLLVALYGLQDRLQEQGYARGGLTVAARRVQAAGRGGDTILAHINPQEAEMLRRAGGSGTINPQTGLREYKPFWKKKNFGLGSNLGPVLAAAAPIVLSIVAPGIGTAIGTSIAGGLFGGTAMAGLVPYIAPALGGALLGAGSSALTGGNLMQGALTGAIGSGLGNVLGQGISSGLDLGLGETASNILGGTILGSGASAIQGRNPFSGALRGAVGAGIGAIGKEFAGDIAGFGPGAGGTEGIKRGIEAGTSGFGTGLTAGMDPKQAAAAGVLSGLASGLIKPSQAVVQNMSGEVPLAETVTQPDGTLAPAPGSAGVMPDGRPAVYQANQQTGMIELQAVPGTYQLNAQTRQMEFRPQQRGILETLGLGAPAGQTPAAGGSQSSGLGNLLGGNLAPLLAGGALLASQGGGQPQAAPPQTRALPASQQEYINRPGVVWDWARMQRDATASNLTLDQFMARNWPRVTSGEYNAAPMAQGGLSMVSRFVKGGGTGRSDEISAKLSDGEYVIDAETVAMLGDGSSKAGAKKLDEMRNQIRQHKGRALAKGKFSPDAKSPLTYLKGVA
jgi:hypothetical protein